MICRNCNYILSGSEQFCPHCGASLPVNTKEAHEQVHKASPPDIFTSEKSRDTDEIKQPSNRIFLPADETPGEYETSSSGKGKKATVIVSLCLLLVFLCTAAFFITQKLDISPVLSALAPTEELTTSAPATTQTAILPENFGIIAPDISYKPLNCYLTSKVAIPLKKGPDDVYATVARINAGEQLQIIGGCLLDEQWMYIYYPTKNCYGWIESAFLTPVQNLEEVTLNEEAVDETTESEQPETTGE